jgi:hypothetical protein
VVVECANHYIDDGSDGITQKQVNVVGKPPEPKKGAGKLVDEQKEVAFAASVLVQQEKK